MGAEEPKNELRPDADEDPDAAKPLERASQGPMQVDPSKYYEPAEMTVGRAPDGMPLMGGDRPDLPGDWLTDDALVCTAADGSSFNGIARSPRKICEHYVALVLPAEGQAKGFAEMRRIRRFCKRLSVAAELFEITGNIYGCTARVPQDSRSAKVIADFEAEQKRIAAEATEESGSFDT